MNKKRSKQTKTTPRTKRRVAQRTKTKRTTPRKNRPKVKYRPRLESGLKYMRAGDSLADAAKKISVKPKQLREYIRATGVADDRNGKWRFKRDRRFRRLPVFSNGESVVVTVADLKSARRVGEYMNVVRQFFETEDIGLLTPYQGKSVSDVSGKKYVFETRPNFLFKIDASGPEPFEIVYAIVKPE